MSWLATVPTTNAIIVSGIGLAWVTFLASLAGWTIPEGWLLFVAAHLGISVTQFTAKRLTHDEHVKQKLANGAKLPEDRP